MDSSPLLPSDLAEKRLTSSLSNQRSTHCMEGQLDSHYVEKSIAQHLHNFTPGHVLNAPTSISQAVCRSAENLYIPNAEISIDGETLTLTKITHGDDSSGKEDNSKLPFPPPPQCLSSSVSASQLGSTNPLTCMHSSTTYISSSLGYSVQTDNITQSLPESYVAFTPSLMNELKPHSSAAPDPLHCDGGPLLMPIPFENGEPQPGYSPSPRLSPMIGILNLSGESSDERLERNDKDSALYSRENSFDQNMSFQETSYESRHPDKIECGRVSDSSRSLEYRVLDSSQTSVPSLAKGERDRKDKKNKKAWYNVLNPTYKTRSVDLKRLFPDLPNDERLIVDYSCALQRDILVQGRLYVTPNYFCFYSKIFGWETFLSIKCKDIVSMTKEKTALVIPNALQINTEAEKHFFTTLAARDKTYLMLFRIWQNALMDQQVSATELWQWVHSCYGDELGLTSDDDDYVAPSTEDDMRSSSSIPVIAEHLLLTDVVPGGKGIKFTNDSAEDGSHCDASSENVQQRQQSHPLYESSKPTQRKSPTKNIISLQSSHPTPVGGSHTATPANDIPTDLSDTCETDPEREKVGVSGGETIVCPNMSTHHSGREIINAVFALPVDTVFTLLFTNSKFMLDLYTTRKTYDVHGSPWQSNLETNQKIRQVTYIVTLPTNSFGPKVSHVTETQVISSFSKPKEIYTVDAEACNGGIPYADSFYVSNHWCLTRESANETRLTVWSQVKYKKNVWGFMKSVIDKNAFSGMENLMNDIHTALLLEVDKTNQKRTRRRRRRIGSKSCDLPDSHLLMATQNEMGKDIHKSTQIPQRKMTLSSVPLESQYTPDNSSKFSVFLLAILLLLNVFLYQRLWSLEDRLAGGGGLSTPTFFLDPSLFKSTNPSEDGIVKEWVKILHQQEILHAAEVERWRRAVNEAADHLKKAEESLRKLHTSIPHTQASKLQSLLQHLQILQQLQAKGGGASPSREPPDPIKEQPPLKEL